MAMSYLRYHPEDNLRPETLALVSGSPEDNTNSRMYFVSQLANMHLKGTIADASSEIETASGHRGLPLSLATAAKYGGSLISNGYCEGMVDEKSGLAIEIEISHSQAKVRPITDTLPAIDEGVYNLEDPVDAEVVRLIKEEGVNANAFQMQPGREEINGVQVSTLTEHESIGYIDEHDNYTPLATMLNEVHPARNQDADY